jgi:hypothetical protein
MARPLPDQLEFLLRPVTESREPTTAPWLLSSFSAEVWHCQFGSVKRVIDFRVELDDGSLLTEPKNNWLLVRIKQFLCLQTSALLIGGRSLGPRAQANRLTSAVHITDYWLLNAGSLGLAASGLENFDANEMRLLTIILGRGRRIQRSIYDPAHVVSEYLRRRVHSLSNDEKHLLLDEVQVLTLRRPARGETKAPVPLLGPDALQGGLLNLTLHEVNIARRLLYSEGLYRWVRGTRIYELETIRLVRAAYFRRTLNSVAKFDKLEFPELEWGSADVARTELPRAPVHTNVDDARAGDEHYQTYLNALRSLRWFTHRTPPFVSPDALDAVDHFAKLAPGSFKEKGRFRLVPFEVTQVLLRKAMDFIYEHGESIVDCTLDVVLGADVARARNFEQLRALNIVDWAIPQGRGTEGYFQILRRSPGLYEMFCILLGVINVCVETVMSRRSEELVNLRPGCVEVNSSGEYVLRHTAGKRGLGVIREEGQKPMPPLAAHALGLLERLRSGASSAGVAVGELLLIRPRARRPTDRCAPRGSQFVKVSQFDLLECVDLMCDYFESPCDQEGRRYYVRNHQLRRSFGFQFIWCGFFGGVDVLGWFFGHGGKRGTKRYYTELISGDAIALKAKVASKAVRAGLPAAEGLTEFISTKHGVTVEALSILDEDTLSDWMEAAIADESLDVTVEFFEGPGGENYRSLILVKGRT